MIKLEKVSKTFRTGSGDFALHTTFWRMMAVALAGGAAGGLLGIHKIS